MTVVGLFLPSIFDLPKPAKKSSPPSPEGIVKNGGVEASRGRSHRRQAASLRGTLSNWASAIISSRLAEREKRSVANRSWDLYTNDAISHGLIEGLIVEVVGTGLSPQPQPMYEWLSKDLPWQVDYQRRAYQSFEIWALDPRNFCDATRRMNFFMLQALAYFHWKLDGIGLFQVVFRDDRNSPFNFCLLPIDPDRLVTPSDLPATEDCYDGVVIDKFGAPKSVWIAKPTEGGWSYKSTDHAKEKDCQKIDVINSKTGLPNILLVCDVRNIAEYRQDSILTCMLKEIKDSSDTVDATVVKALISNLFTFFIQNSDYTSAGTYWEDRIVELERGTIIRGSPEEIPHMIEADHPGVAFERLLEGVQGRLGMATCRGPENIAKSYKASYSASQASMENAEKVNNYDRSILVNGLCQPAEMIRQYECVLRGILPVDDWRDFILPMNFYAYTRTEWLPQPTRPIDRLKYANANRTDLEGGTKTLADIAGEQNRDWRMVKRQRFIEADEHRKLVGEFGFDPDRGQENAGSQQQDKTQQALAQLADDIEELKASMGDR